MSRPFDEARYKGLLEGLEAAEIRQSRLNAELRYEAEFFRKLYLREDTELSRWTQLTIGEFANVTDGPHGYHVVDENSPVVMLTAKNAKDWFSDREGADLIAEWVDVKNKRSSLEEGDVILSTRGTVGMCALVTKEVLPANIDQDVARISWLDKGQFLPEFVVAYLNSSIGQDHISRHSSGMVQQGMSLQKVREIPLPMLSFGMQTTIAETVQAALKLRREGVQKREDAERILLRTLGLENWQPPEPLTYTRRASDMWASERLDAEYFHPKWDIIEELVKQNGFVTLDTICSEINYGTVPTSPYTEDGTGVPYIKGLNLHNTEIEGRIDRITSTDKLPQKFFTKEGDIVISQMGTVGDVGVIRKNQEGWLFASFTIRARIHEKEKYCPKFVGFYIQKIAKNYYLKRNIAQASVRQNTDLPTIRSLYVPILAIEEQRKIAYLLECGYSAHRQAYALLEAAKRAVEISIEDSEAAALTYLDAFNQPARP